MNLKCKLFFSVKTMNVLSYGKVIELGYPLVLVFRNKNYAGPDDEETRRKQRQEQIEVNAVPAFRKKLS